MATCRLQRFRRSLWLHMVSLRLALAERNWRNKLLDLCRLLAHRLLHLNTFNRRPRAPSHTIVARLDAWGLRRKSLPAPRPWKAWQPPPLHGLFALHEPKPPRRAQSRNRTEDPDPLMPDESHENYRCRHCDERVRPGMPRSFVRDQQAQRHACKKQRILSNTPSRRWNMQRALRG